MERKWLKILFYVQIVGLVFSLLSAISGVGTILAWGNRLVSVGVIVALFSLVPCNGRYRKAAIFSCVTLVCGLINAASSMAVLPLIGSVCSLVAVYQEYSAHSEVVEEYSPKLSQRWHSLFMWQIIVGVVVGVVGATLTVLLSMTVGDETSAITTIILFIINGSDMILRIIYLIYLKQMWQMV